LDAFPAIAMSPMTLPSDSRRASSVSNNQPPVFPGLLFLSPSSVSDGPRRQHAYQTGTSGSNRRNFRSRGSLHMQPVYGHRSLSCLKGILMVGSCYEIRVSTTCAAACAGRQTDLRIAMPIGGEKNLRSHAEFCCPALGSLMIAVPAGADGDRTNDRVSHTCDSDA